MERPEGGVRTGEVEEEEMEAGLVAMAVEREETEGTVVDKEDEDSQEAE